MYACGGGGKLLGAAGDYEYTGGRRRGERFLTDTTTTTSQTKRQKDKCNGVCRVSCLGESGTGLAESARGLRVPIGLVGIELQKVVCILVNNVA